jgi:lipoate-protein ligase A
LESAAAGQATLRFYQWSEPTLSLGYFQPVADREQHPASRECPLVRRASGGGAIVHDRELTYSMAVPQTAGHWPAAGGLYDICHQTLIVTLAELGIPAALWRATAICRGEDARASAEEPFLCFQRRSCSDIVLGDAKIVGSAQRRRRGGVLQHGSILLGQSPFAPELPGLNDLTGRAIDAAELAARWRSRLAKALRTVIREVSLGAEEQQRTEFLTQTRFSSSGFLQRR